jgi:two-component system nitrate/nitrite response regulator NarL
MTAGGLQEATEGVTSRRETLVVDVVVVGDNAMLVDLIADSLGSAGVSVAPIATTDLADVITGLGRVDARVAVVDLTLSGSPTVPIIERLDRSGTTCIVLTGSTDPTQLGAALDAGALAILSTSETFASLLHATRTALADDHRVSVANTAAIREAARFEQRRRESELAPFAQLTRREREILTNLIEGRPANEIASRTDVSIATVRSHIKALLRKLGVHSQLAAVAMAHRAGWPTEIRLDDLARTGTLTGESR